MVIVLGLLSHILLLIVFILLENCGDHTFALYGFVTSLYSIVW